MPIIPKSSGLLCFLMGGNLTIYLASLSLIFLSLFKSFFEVLIADFLKSDILRLLTFSADRLDILFYSTLAKSAGLRIAYMTGSLARVTPSFWSKEVLLIVWLGVMDDILLLFDDGWFKFKSYNLEL